MADCVMSPKNEDYVREDTANRIKVEKGSNSEGGSQGKSEMYDDVSAMEFSRKQVEVGHLKNSLAQVTRESKRGNRTSLNILKELAPFALKQLKMGEKEGKKKENDKIEVVEADLSFEENDYNEMKVAPLDGSIEQKEEGNQT